MVGIDGFDGVWARPDRATVAPSTSELFSGRWQTWVLVGANGSLSNHAGLMTGAGGSDDNLNLAGGDDRTCLGWSSNASTDTGRVGFANQLVEHWNNRNVSCGSGLRLFCADFDEGS